MNMPTSGFKPLQPSRGEAKELAKFVSLPPKHIDVLSLPFILAYDAWAYSLEIFGVIEIYSTVEEPNELCVVPQYHLAIARRLTPQKCRRISRTLADKVLVAFAPLNEWRETPLPKSVVMRDFWRPVNH